MKLRQRIELLKNDKKLALIFLLHLLLIGLHVYENYVGQIEYHWYLRAGGCAVISLCIFLFGRKGLSYGLMIFACALVYVNKFYNYATIFFMLIAIGANPKIRKIAPWVYLVNVFIAYSQKRLGITPFLIHVIYCVMFHIKMDYVFETHKPDKLNLTEAPEGDRPFFTAYHNAEIEKRKGAQPLRDYRRPPCKVHEGRFKHRLNSL